MGQVRRKPLLKVRNQLKTASDVEEFGTLLDQPTQKLRRKTPFYSAQLPKFVDGQRLPDLQSGQAHLAGGDLAVGQEAIDPAIAAHGGRIVKLIGKEISTVTIEGIASLPFEEGDGRRGRGRSRGASPRGRGRERTRTPRAESSESTAPQATVLAPVAVAPTVEGSETPASEGKSRRRRRGGRKDSTPAMTTDAVIDAAIPHPTETLHRHDLLEASTALPVTMAVVPIDAQRSLNPVQPHENRHQRRAQNKPQHEEDAMVAGHGFGDHLPAFLRRPVRLPSGDRRTGK